MKIPQTIAIIISWGLLSCNNNGNGTVVKNKNAKVDSVTIGDPPEPKPKIAVPVADTTRRFVVDDYPVTNEMLTDRTSNHSSYQKQSGQTYAYDKAWFGNDTLKQTLVFELYTDYHRAVTYHFFTNDIPADLINSMELHVDGGALASEQQKRQDFGGFLKQTTKINSSYFVSVKGCRLGDTKQKVLDMYGNPDHSSVRDGIEKWEWNFIGDASYDGKTDLKGKPLAKDNFGHQVIMYFRNGKLTGQVLHNDIP